MPKAGRLILAVLILGCFLLLGGVAAVIVGDAGEPKHAIAYGLGFEGLLSGVIRGGTA